MILQTLLALLLVQVSHATATVTATQTTAYPLITEPPSLEDRAVTSFHTIVSTSYPQNRWSIGYGKIEGKEGFYTAACVDGLFALSGIWAGCGDLIFTRCVGATAFARLSTVSCMGTCVTHKIFDYKDESQSSTRFIACNFPGTYDGAMTLLKTPIGAAAESTSDEASTATAAAETTTASTTDSAAGIIRPEFQLLLIAVVFVLFF